MCIRDSLFPIGEAEHSCHDRLHQYGTRFIVHKRFRERVIDFKHVSPQICFLRIKEKFKNYSLISVHALTEESPEIEKEEFYELFDIDKTCLLYTSRCV